jgi:hypothetical protein
MSVYLSVHLSVYLSVFLCVYWSLTLHFFLLVSVVMLVSVFAVFGPTLVKTSDDNMMSMITDMAQQCCIIESILSNCEWFFNEDSSELQEKYKLFCLSFCLYFIVLLLLFVSVSVF